MTNKENKKQDLRLEEKVIVHELNLNVDSQDCKIIIYSFKL